MTRRLLFASWHFYLDNSNGASISTRALLRSLSNRGWSVQTFCGPSTDYLRPVSIDELLRSHKVISQDAPSPAQRSALTAFRDGGIDSLLYRPTGAGRAPSREFGEEYLRLLARSLKVLKPDVVATYGSLWLGSRILSTARASGAKTVVFLHNLSYRSRDYFQYADLTIVPSYYASGFYSAQLGLETSAVPPVIEWDKVLPQDAAAPRDAVLFVNPEPCKGAYFFSQIVKETWSLRPDIPFLVVGGRSEADDLRRSGVDWHGVNNLYWTPNTSTPRDFYRRAKLTLVPSLVPETFGRVAAESLGVGAPVITSNRGALPETVGDSGVIVRIPSTFGSDSRALPTPSEVAPWVQALISLWDDADRYATLQSKGLGRAQNWSTDRTTDRHEELFLDLLNRR